MVLVELVPGHTPCPVPLKLCGERYMRGSEQACGHPRSPALAQRSPFPWVLGQKVLTHRGVATCGLIDVRKRLASPRKCVWGEV